MNNDYRIIILKGTTPVCEGFIESITINNNERHMGQWITDARLEVVAPNISVKKARKLLEMDIQRVVYNNALDKPFEL
jgi:hypothetical protein